MNPAHGSDDGAGRDSADGMELPRKYRVADVVFRRSNIVISQSAIVCWTRNRMQVHSLTETQWDTGT